MRSPTEKWITGEDRTDCNEKCSRERLASKGSESK